MPITSLMPFFLPVVIAALGVFAWMIFWRFWDEYRKKPMGILIIAALWGAILTFFLKNFVDGASQSNTHSTGISFFVTVIFLEELVKAIAEINALESSEEKTGRRNDGIFYGVAAALGFIFVETIFYLVNATDFWAVFWGRLIYTAPAHMAFTGIFGMYYGRAYLSSSLIGVEHKRHQAPVAVLGHIIRCALKRIPEEKRNYFTKTIVVLREVFSVFTLHITRNHLILGIPTHGHAPAELITEGFLVSLYLHLGYDFLLSSVVPVYRIAGLIGSTLLFAFLLWRFVRLETEEQKFFAEQHECCPIKAKKAPMLSTEQK